MKKWLLILCLILVLSARSFPQPVSGEAPILLIRCDDIGMCHAVNMAAERLIESKLPFSASVMFTCPWYQEAVDFLRRHPHISVGVHLTLNAEWKNYRWGPVAGWKAVVSLTDSCGYFFPSRALFFAHQPKLKEVEIELRAQIDRALTSGLSIDYLDYHMSTAVSTEPLRKLIEKLAQEYQLGISRYFGEMDIESMYAVAIANKADTLFKRINELSHEQVNLLVCHIGLDTPEMAAMIDLNSFGLPQMSQHRQAELQALLSEEFRQHLQQQNVQLETYRSLINKLGLSNMMRPQSLNQSGK
ncbi:ChbG/HpnK family deacetylase [candidate division KSB1 bacterium]|nr:ChbG/HpnK family deacetylase [candidate division KSB1 bacterium]